MGANMQKIVLSDGYDNKWVQGIIVGFELTRTGNKQKILVRLEDGDLASDLMNNPIKYQNLNQIGKLVGQQPVRVGEEILLPGFIDSFLMIPPVDPIPHQSKFRLSHRNSRFF